MMKKYIKPEAKVIRTAVQLMLNVSGGAKNGNAKQWNFSFDEEYDDSEETEAYVWPKQKSLWDE